MGDHLRGVDLRRGHQDGRVEHVARQVGDRREVRGRARREDPRGERHVVVRVERQAHVVAVVHAWGALLRRAGDRAGRAVRVAPAPRRGAEDSGRERSRPAHAEGEDLALEQAAWIGAEVAELVHLDTGFEAVDAFDVRVGVAVALEEPEAEQLVVQTACQISDAQVSCVVSTYPIEPPGGTMATRRSKALQLFVYMSRTRARGTSAFLPLWVTLYSVMIGTGGRTCSKA